MGLAPAQVPLLKGPVVVLDVVVTSKVAPVPVPTLKGPVVVVVIVDVMV